MMVRKLFFQFVLMAVVAVMATVACGGSAGVSPRDAERNILGEMAGGAGVGSSSILRAPVTFEGVSNDRYIVCNRFGQVGEASVGVDFLGEVSDVNILWVPADLAVCGQSLNEMKENIKYLNSLVEAVLNAQTIEDAKSAASDVKNKIEREVNR